MKSAFYPWRSVQSYTFKFIGFFSEFVGVLLVLNFVSQVETQEEYDNVLSSFPFHDEGAEIAPFPKILPFSSMVPKVYQQVKEFIYACLKFSEDLNLR